MVFWLMLEMRDLKRRQKKLSKTTTVITKSLLRQNLVTVEEISGIDLDG